MAKTGGGQREGGDLEGTAEGALMARAAHALHAPDPVLRDDWALQLLRPEIRASLRDPDHYRDHYAPDASPFSGIFAVGLGALRHAEDTVERCVDRGIGQYVCLGAGFDTFALRRHDLADRLIVFEVDFPDVQALKRERIEAAGETPHALPRFVPVDFEDFDPADLAEALAARGFDPERPAVFSWMNVLPYLTPEATRETLTALARLSASGSHLVANYAAAVPLSEDQRAFLATLQGATDSRSEPLRSAWPPDEFLALLDESGFDVAEHLDETDLTRRYFEGRSDGLRPGLPARVVTAVSR